MKYLVNPVKNENDFMWEVYEVASDQVVERFFFEEDAVHCATFMEKGGAFDGWTPPFILKQVVAHEDINQKFTMMFED